MKLSRRHFLAWAGLGALGAVACEGFGIREGELSIQSPVSLPEDLVRGKDNWYASLCRNCPSCEGILVRVMEGRAKKIQGNPYYPTNQGKSHARCEAGVQALYHPDRISGPMKRGGNRGSGQFDPIAWDPEGMDTLTRQINDRGINAGPGRAVMVTKPMRGHLGMLASRFAQATGIEHLTFEAVDNNVYRAAVKNVYEQDVLPDFDIENANFILSFGADFLSTWISPTRWNRGYGEFRQGEGRSNAGGRDRGTLYHVDSRFSMTAANADKWIPVRPGWEGYLALSIAQVIVAENLQAPGVDVEALLGGDAGRQMLNSFRPEVAAPLVGITPEIAGGGPGRVHPQAGPRLRRTRPQHRYRRRLGGSALQRPVQRRGRLRTQLAGGQCRRPGRRHPEPERPVGQRASHGLCFPHRRLRAPRPADTHRRRPYAPVAQRGPGARPAGLAAPPRRHRERSGLIHRQLLALHR